jgi:KaiC/GvpD/RAD55 family RecA-like ATPase
MEKLKTYVDGFDELMGGGIPKNSVVLVAGAPGTMKSSFAYSVLYNHAVNGTTGLYLSLEQSNLKEQMESIGFSPKKVEGRLSVVDVGDIRFDIDEEGHPAKYHKKGKADMLDIDFYREHLKKLKKVFSYELLVIDSLEALESIADIKNRRYELFYLFKWFKELDATIFLISEMEPNLCTGTPYDEGFLSDGILHLSLQTLNDVESQRRLRCIKMRGTKHSTDYLALMFEDGAFQVTRLMRT